jgi:hypothetical protein
LAGDTHVYVARHVAGFRILRAMGSNEPLRHDLAGTAIREDIIAILGDAEVSRWWPSVYLRVRVEAPGDERGVGKVVDLWTKGFLPYLRWRFEVTRADRPTASDWRRVVTSSASVSGL